MLDLGCVYCFGLWLWDPLEAMANQQNPPNTDFRTWGLCGSLELVRAFVWVCSNAMERPLGHGTVLSSSEVQTMRVLA